MPSLHNSKHVFQITQFGNNRKGRNTTTSQQMFTEMSLLKWYRLFGCVKDSPQCFFPIWHRLGLGRVSTPPHPLPTPPPAQLVFGCGAEHRGLHNTTQQERDRIWQQGPQRSDPAAVKEISWYVPILPLTKSQVILERLQDQRADLCTCMKGRPDSLRQQGRTRGSWDLLHHQLQCSVTLGTGTGGRPLPLS